MQCSERGLTPASLTSIDEKAKMITILLRSGLNAFLACIGGSILACSWFVPIKPIMVIIVGSLGAGLVLFGMSVIQKKALNLSRKTLVIQNVASTIIILIVSALFALALAL